MSIASSLASFNWEDRKINLIDTPGEPSFVADALAALRVCEGAVFVVNAVMGVEVRHRAAVAARRGARALAARVREHARPRARRLLPHARLAQGAPSASTSSPPRSRSAPSTRSRGVIDLIDMKAYEYEGERTRQLQGDPDPGRAPGAGRGVPREADGRGRRGLRRADGALPRGRGDLARGDRPGAQERRHRTARSSRSPAAWRRRTSPPTGCSTRSSRTCRRPSRRAPFHAGDRDTRGRGRGRHGRVRLQDARRPVRRARSTCSASTRAW